MEVKKDEGEKPYARPDAPVRETRKRKVSYASRPKYWNQVWKSDGFDIHHVEVTVPYAMEVFKCDDPEDYPLVVKLYAQLGIYWYNQEKPKLSDLKIVKVVVETKDIVEPTTTSEIVVKGNATVYIMYEHNLGEGQLLRRTAIVTRSVDPTTRRFCLVGKVSKYD